VLNMGRQNLHHRIPFRDITKECVLRGQSAATQASQTLASEKGIYGGREERRLVLPASPMRQAVTVTLTGMFRACVADAAVRVGVLKITTDEKRKCAMQQPHT